MTQTINNEPDPIAFLLNQAYGVELFKFARALAGKGFLRDADARKDFVNAAIEEKRRFQDEYSIRRLSLALGLAAIQGETADEQLNLLELGLFKLVEEGGEAQRYALDDLTYVDQFIFGYTNQGIHVRGALKNWLRGYRDQIMATPGGRDYQRLGLDRLDIDEESQGPSGSAPAMIYIVGSVKGGVGKTSVAKALLEKLSETRRPVILDCDFLGPSLQHVLDIPAVTKAHIGGGEQLQGGTAKTRWLYPTLSDLVLYKSHANLKVPKSFESSSSGGDLPATIFDELVLESTTGVGVVTLPDSPTFLADFHRFVLASEVIRGIRFYPCLLELIGRLSEQYNSIIIDMSPGLLGQNDSIIQALSERFGEAVHLIIVSSPRSLDLGTAVYEGTWTAADGNVAIRRPVVQVVNMWDTDGVGDPEGTLVRYGDAAFQRRLANGTPSSADAIAFSRWWSCLYAINARWKPLHFVGVPYLHDIRRGAYLPDGATEMHAEWARFKESLVGGLDKVWDNIS